MSQPDLGPPLTHIILPYEFSATRIMDTHITPCTMKLEIAILSGHSEQDAANKAAIGFTKIRTWLEIALNDAILVAHNSVFDEIMLTEADNAVLITPDEPNDMILSLVLLSKLRKISEGYITVVSISIASSDSGNIKRFTSGDISDLLPGIDYLGEEAIHKQPWWERETIETVDFIKADMDDETKDTYFEELVVRDPLKEIEKAFLNQEADVITIDAWKPAK